MEIVTPSHGCCGDAKGGSQMGFPGSALAQQDDRLGALDVAAGGKLANAGGGDLRALVEVELVEGLDARQARLLESPLDGAALALLDLGGEQRLQVTQVAVLLANHLLSQLGELRAQDRQTQQLAVFENGGLVEGGNRGLHCAFRFASKAS